MIPQLVKPINGLNYDLQELEKSKDYCFEHAARAEEAQNLINDLIKSGLVNSTFYDWSCSKINEELKFEELMEAPDCISKGRLSGCT